MKSSNSDTSTNLSSTKKTLGIACILSLSLLVFFIMACSAGFDSRTETREDSFNGGEVTKVVVNGENGNITLNESSDDRVVVRATLRKPDDINYEAIQKGDTISVEAKAKKSGIFNFGESPGASIDITAPPNTRVELRTENGTIKVDGMQQSGTARTSNGKVELSNVAGAFDVSTSNGAVEITNAKGEFDVKTINGKIEFKGEISGGSNSMTTSNGSVNVELQGNPNLKVDASTNNGSVISNLPITIASAVDEKHLVGTIGNGDAELFIETSNGSVMIQ